MKKLLFLLGLFLYTQASVAQQADSANTVVFQAVDIDAEFPGGIQAWTSYISKSLQKYNKQFRKEGIKGSVVILFIVDKNGSVTNARVLSCKEAGVSNCLPASSSLAQAGLEIISNSPAWIPASQNGKPVNAYRRQPLTIAFQ
jgi:periplasmic protein TonB